MLTTSVNLSRRGFVAGLGASALLNGSRAIADERPAVPTYRTATELTQALAARQISARELLDAAIARIEALDRSINAVVCATSTGRGSTTGRCRRRGVGARRASYAPRCADDSERAIQRRGPADELGFFEHVPGLGARMPTRWACSG